MLTLTWTGPTPAGSRTVQEPSPRAGMEIPVDIGVLAHNQGDSVQVSYRVQRGAGTIASEVTTARVLAILDNSGALPRPALAESGPRELDMAAFNGDAHAQVERYRLAARDQRYWLTVSGYDAQGLLLVLDIAKGEAIRDASPATLSLGTVRRSDLQRYKNGSDITLTLYVTFDGSTDLRDAVRFRTTSLIIRQAGSTTLPAPSVDEANANREINPFTARALTVRIPASVDFQAGDTLDVRWKGTDAGGSRDVPISNPTSGMGVNIDTGVLAYNQGDTVAVTYARKRAGVEASSAVYTATVEKIYDDSTALPRPLVTEGPGRTLDLATFKGDAHVTVEPFLLVHADQRHWVTLTGTRERDGTRVVIELSKGQRLGSIVPPVLSLASCARKWLEDLKDNTPLKVDLWVTFDGSQDKTTAVHFRPTDLTVRVPAAVAFLPPKVSEAEPDGKTLVPFKAKDHLSVYISSRDTFQPGDVLEVQWRGKTANGTRLVPVAGTPKPGMSVPIPPQVLAYNQGSTVNVTFTVTRAGVIHTSPTLALAVKAIEDGSPDLPRPIVSEGPDYELDLTKFTGPAHVVVEPFAFIAVNQRYWVEAIGSKHQTQTTWFVATAKAFSVIGGPAIALGQIGRHWLDDLDDNSPLEIRLWVAFDGTNNRGNAVAFRHTRLTLKKRGGSHRRHAATEPAPVAAVPGMPPPAPLLPGVRDVLDPFALAAGFAVALPALATPAGSAVTLCIDGHDGASSLRIGPAPYAPGLRFTIDAPALYANVGGALSLYYLLTPPGEPTMHSQVRRVGVGIPEPYSSATSSTCARARPSRRGNASTASGPRCRACGSRRCHADRAW